MAANKNQIIHLLQTMGILLFIGLSDRGKNDGMGIFAFYILQRIGDRLIADDHACTAAIGRIIHFAKRTGRIIFDIFKLQIQKARSNVAGYERRL